MKTKVAFILGAGHSGSTLLDLLLDGHSQIAGVGEMNVASPGRVCTCGKEARTCPLWSVVFGIEPWPSRDIYRSKLSFFFNHGPYRAVETRVVIDKDEYMRSTAQAYKKIAEVTGASIVIDSSKSPERAELLSADSNIEPVLIHLVRDGRAVTWSYIRKYHRLVPALFLWAFLNLKVELLKRRFSGKTIFVRYEDLVDAPERELSRICRALGLAYEKNMLDFRSGAHHQIAGNRMRLGTDATIRRDDAWRHDMPLFPRIMFAGLFGPMNSHYQHVSVS